MLIKKKKKRQREKKEKKNTLCFNINKVYFDVVMKYQVSLMHVRIYTIYTIYHIHIYIYMRV